MSWTTLPPRLPDFARLMAELPARAGRRDSVPVEAEPESPVPLPPSPAPVARALRRTDPLLRRLLRLLSAGGKP